MSTSDNPALASLDLATAYKRMRLIRRFEQSVVDLVNKGEIPGATHEYTGQEAIAVGVCSALTVDDRITSTHRGHGHLLAKGADLTGMFAELMARETGLNKGRGGSMHAADVSLGILGANGIVGAGAPIGAGSAWVSKQAGHSSVVVTFFGDGALNQGVLLETMNLATILNLPMVFVCENNGYAVSLRVTDAVGGDIQERANGFGMAAEEVDGMDVNAVYERSAAAIERARNGGGPTFINAITYRFVGHNTGEQYLGLDYRTDDEIESWRPRDPLTLAAAQLDQGTVDRIDGEVEQAIADSIEVALSAPHPDAATASHFMYTDWTVQTDLPEGAAS